MKRRLLRNRPQTQSRALACEGAPELSEETPLPVKTRGLDGDLRASGGQSKNGLCAYGCLLFRFACGIHGFSDRAKRWISSSHILAFGTIEDCTRISPVEAANRSQRPNVNLPIDTMPGTTTTTTTATLRDNRLFVQYRRRERVDANTTDTSRLCRVELKLYRGPEDGPADTPSRTR